MSNPQSSNLRASQAKILTGVTKDKGEDNTDGITNGPHGAREIMSELGGDVLPGLLLGEMLPRHHLDGPLLTFIEAGKAVHTLREEGLAAT